jgi:transcriptional/translational regulatory protein YebC/TACO1
MGAQWKAKGKDLAANAKGRMFGKLAKDIMVAARNGADKHARCRCPKTRWTAPSKKGLA